jgi:hypothetical protein
MPDRPELPEIIPPEYDWKLRRIWSSPTKKQRTTTTVISTGVLVSFLLWAFNEFTSLRGWIHVLTSRIILVGMWIAGCLLVLIVTWGMQLKRRRLIVCLSVVLMGFACVALDWIAPNPNRAGENKNNGTPPVAVATVTPTPTVSPSPNPKAKASPLATSPVSSLRVTDFIFGPFEGNNPTAKVFFVNDGPETVSVTTHRKTQLLGVAKPPLSNAEMKEVQDSEWEKFLAAEASYQEKRITTDVPAKRELSLELPIPPLTKENLDALAGETGKSIILLFARLTWTSGNYIYAYDACVYNVGSLKKSFSCYSHNGPEKPRRTRLEQSAPRDTTKDRSLKLAQDLNDLAIKSDQYPGPDPTYYRVFIQRQIDRDFLPRIQNSIAALGAKGISVQDLRTSCTVMMRPISRDIRECSLKIKEAVAELP